MCKKRYIIKIQDDEWFADKLLYINDKGKSYSGYLIDPFRESITKFEDFNLTQFDIIDNDLKYWKLKDVLELTNFEYKIINNYDDKIDNILSASRNINSAIYEFPITPTIKLERLTGKRGETFIVDELYMDSLHNILWKQEK